MFNMINYGDEALELLSKLVSINTVNDPVKNTKPSREAVNYLIDWFSKYGIDIDVIENNGYYSVYGVIGNKPKVLLLAHFDTVPVIKERWSSDPFKLTIIDNKAYGRGALDDKSNVVSVMIAVRELCRSGYSVVFGLTSDEETGGLHGARIIANKVLGEINSLKYVVNADGMGMKIINKRRMGFNAKIVVESVKKTIRGIVKKITFESMYPITQRSHSAYFIPGVDVHALLTASSFIRENNVYVVELRGDFVKSNIIPPRVELTYVEPCSNCNYVEVDYSLTNLLKNLIVISRTPLCTDIFSEYGVSINPNIYLFRDNKHIVEFDIRAMCEIDSVRKFIAKVVEETIPEASIEISDSYGKYLYTPRDSKIIKVFTKILSKYGYEPVIGEGGGISDSRYFTGKNLEVVDFGPRGGGMHGDNEYVLIDDLKILPNIYIDLVKELSTTD